MSRLAGHRRTVTSSPSGSTGGERLALSVLVMVVAAVLALALPTMAFAANAPAAPFEWVERTANTAEMSSAMKVFLTLTALSFLPAMLICMTCFIRIVIVMSMLRHAIGLMETPPNIVVITLSLFLTLFAMQPVIQKVNTVAIEPYMSGATQVAEATRLGLQPLKDFMIRQTREQDLVLMVDTAGSTRPKSVEDVSMWHLIPAFMLSELRAAFVIGFTIFLPFLLIDLIVASVLMALGMMMVPPSTVSIPLKLLLFVLIDGWHIVTRALLGSIH
ncbi:flagellar type III secretion system pore protein FliP [Aquabacterium sp.]|uniref:flagellar type III secretion system pore protein FliP n=1 Tax=Aquabacterium sp. TaxID=1872578 RepID=UPI002C5AEBBA|nr:flagellar type III secretion system pore protein FliP [Aquabacterium sp.]HSW06371.1 flagellar type III secretion system pore protein FliP [Aquabacterium sp.]